MLSSANYYRTIFIYTLYPKHHYSLLISNSYLTRCKLWMNYPPHSRKHSITILFIPIPTHRSRNLLPILQPHRNLKYWSINFYRNHSHSLYRLRLTMRTNKILRGYRNYKSILSYPLHWLKPSRMNLRRLRSRQCNIKPILRPSLPSTICYRSLGCNSPTISSPNRLQQPPWTKLRLRPDSIPQLLLN